MEMKCGCSFHFDIKFVMLQTSLLTSCNKLLLDRDRELLVWVCRCSHC